MTWSYATLDERAGQILVAAGLAPSSKEIRAVDGIGDALKEPSGEEAPRG